MSSRNPRTTAASAHANASSPHTTHHFVPIASKTAKSTKTARVANSAGSQQGKKRKMDAVAAEQSPNGKYYAVRVGLKTGVFTTWTECQRYITGFPGAQYKSFPSREDAQAFVAGRNPPNDKSKPTRYYGVAVGRVPGIYTNWAHAQEQIDGWKMPKYRKFDTYAEAEAFVRDSGVDLAPRPQQPEFVVIDEDESVRTVKKVKRDNEPVARPRTRYTVVYTDGSSRGNGKVGAMAGVGVWFGENDSRNISERLHGLQTNQRAELTAVLRTLQVIPKDEHLEIRTDSQYSINCITDWWYGWKRKGWVTSGNGKIKNLDLIQAIRLLYDERAEAGTETKFTWVKGHANEPGNVAADGLAVAGSMKPL